MSEHEHWQLDGSAPELYQRYLVPAITSVWAADLIDRVNPSPGERLLDIACGTGAVTRLAALRMMRGRIVGLDFNPGMLGVARSEPNSGAQIEWIEGSASSLPFDDGSFDVVLCQLGLQFFPNRPLAVSEMRRVLAPGGRLALSVYSSIEQTPAAYAFVRALDQRMGADASKIKRAEHIFVKPDDLGVLMTVAGFDSVCVSTVTQHITFPSVLDYVRFQLSATPMAALLGAGSDVEREAVINEIASATEAFLEPAMLKDGRLCFPQEGFVATASRLA